MSEETTTPVEHASIGENGVIMLSDEALAAMENVETPDVPDEHIEEVTPAPIVEAPTARKIKHNGNEVEIAPEQEIELLQKGYNYEQKMAQLESERAKIQSYNGLVSAIEASPEIRQKVSQALGYQPAPVKEETPQFDDPIEQLKWETRQEVMREVEEKFVKPMQQQTEATAHMQAVNATRQQVQADPQYDAVQAEIIRTIQALPESVGKNLYLQLDQDPRSYLEMFNSTKERLKLTSTTPTVKEVPEPTKRETKAPLLETGNNNAPDASEQQRQTERIKELTKKSKAGDFRATGELMAMMA